MKSGNKKADLPDRNVLIIGAGFCGLASGLSLTRQGIPFTLVEKSAEVGGLSRTIRLGGEQFELGPHIYFYNDPEVLEFWRDLVGEAMKTYERRTHLFYNGKFIKSPLNIIDTLYKLGPIVVAKIILSFGYAKIRSHKIENAADWVVANFGRELHERFFRVYNEKIWGLASEDIAPDWAGQRIKSSLLTMVYKSLRRDPKFIVKSFAFPDGGSKVIATAQEQLIRANPRADLRLNCEPKRIVRTKAGFDVWLDGNEGPKHFSDIISTIHLSDIFEILEYEDKDHDLITSNLDKLLYRDLILVNFVFNADEFRNTQDHWIDIHDPEVRALRVTNFSNYQPSQSNQVAIGMEYNVSAGDQFSGLSDKDVLNEGLKDLGKMGLSSAQPIASSVLRLPKAYPVYFKGYREVTAPLFEELEKLPGLVLAGRNAMYKWNNMHHSVKTGLLAAENVLGASHDLFAVRGNVTIGKDSD